MNVVEKRDGLEIVSFRVSRSIYGSRLSSSRSNWSLPLPPRGRFLVYSIFILVRHERRRGIEVSLLFLESFSSFILIFLSPLYCASHLSR